ncbi:MAG: ATP-binding cassette domain-containing protein [Pseudomonadota bacterium]
MSAELINATVERGGKQILRNVSVSCPAGAITAFCGPNGAGKTTALSLMTGAIAPNAGEAKLDDLRVRRQRPEALARRRAVVSQYSQLSFPFAVYEVIAMGRTPHFGRVTPEQDNAAIEAAIDLMALSPLIDRNYLTLSGGEKQRVNIARALAQIWREGTQADDQSEPRPPWLFLDEPTNALDLKYQLALMALLGRLRDDGWGIIVVLHDLNLVKKYADRTVLFKDGSLSSTGPSHEVLSPQTVMDTFDLDAPYELGLVASAQP